MQILSGTVTSYSVFTRKGKELAKEKNMKKIITLLALFIPISLFANRYYVSTSGNNANNGLTESTPWQTLAYAETNAIKAGDTICLKRGDTFNITSTLTINTGGASGHPIVWDGSLWGPATGKKATITTTTLWMGAMIRVLACDYLVIENIIFSPNDNNTDGVVVGGSSGQNDEDYITIQDCEFYDLGGSTANIHAVLVETMVNDITNVTIQRNKFDGVGGSAIFLYGGRSDMGAKPAWTKDCYIGYNTITNYSREGTAECIGINNGIDGCIIEHNYSDLGTEGEGYGMVFGSNELYYGGSAGYYPKNITIQYNEIRTNQYSAVFIQGAQALSLNFYYNKFYRTTKGAGGQGAVRIIDDESTTDYTGAKIKFYNNDIICGGLGNAAFADVSQTQGIVDFKNNIAINTETSSSGCMYIASVGSTSHSYNSYYRGSTADLTYFTQSASYTNYSRNDSTTIEPTGLFSDPKIKDITNFDWTLKSNSRLINAGVNVGLAMDFAGNAIVGNPDIGAYEYTAGTSTPAIPAFQSAVIENATPGRLDMTYNLTLGNIVPAASSFSVMVNSTARTVSTVTVSGTKVQLNLASTVVYGDVVTVSYTAPATNPLQTSAGGKAVSIASKAVTNNVSAINPVYISSVVENDTPSRIEMTYNMTLTNVAPSASAFTVIVNSAARAVSSVIISDTKIYLSLASPVAFGDVVTVAYTKPATNYLKATSGGQAATISAQAVVNNVVNPPVGPEYISSVVENATPTIVEVSFDQSLANVIPSASSFIVKVNSVAVTVNSVSISGTNLRLSISKTIYAGDIVTVSYVVPEQNAIQVASGAEAAALSNETVINNSELVVVKDPVKTRLLTAYPNPVTDYVTIRIAGSFTELNTIRFFNMSGTLCLEVKPDPGLNEITIPVNLKAGLYLVQLTSGKTTIFALKISVKK